MKVVLCSFILFVLVVISHAQLQHCNYCGSLNLQQRRVCCNYGYTQCCRIRVPTDQTFPGSGAPGQGGYPGSSGGLNQPGFPNYYGSGLWSSNYYGSGSGVGTIGAPIGLQPGATGGGVGTIGAPIGLQPGATGGGIGGVEGTVGAQPGGTGELAGGVGATVGVQPGATGGGAGGVEGTIGIYPGGTGGGVGGVGATVGVQPGGTGGGAGGVGATVGVQPGGTGGGVGGVEGTVGIYPGGTFPHPLPNLPLGGDIILRKKPAASDSKDA
ncbi:uncharacterized protein LOC143239345 [Tachypleus tridentatus]|uniref:uncharacterized protein LOC143239345 n=1 Tax=Tachypleus tridentatus TaxID=6853 RepID=UPI003FD3F394